MYELKGKAITYIILVNIWYGMVVLLCTTGNSMMFSLGVLLGVMPYIVLGCILLLCSIDKLVRWVNR